MKESVVANFDYKGELHIANGEWQRKEELLD
jgi:hypothetical protein